MAVPGYPRYQSHQQCIGTSASLRSDVAQADPRNLQREGQSMGGAGIVVSPNLSHSGSADVSPAGGSGEMPVRREDSRSEMDHPSGAAAGV